MQIQAKVVEQLQQQAQHLHEGLRLWVRVTSINEGKGPDKAVLEVPFVWFEDSGDDDAEKHYVRALRYVRPDFAPELTRSLSVPVHKTFVHVLGRADPPLSDTALLLLEQQGPRVCKDVLQAHFSAQQQHQQRRPRDAASDDEPAAKVHVTTVAPMLHDSEVSTGGSQDEIGGATAQACAAPYDPLEGS